MKKVAPHKEAKQRELQHSVTDWLITDSQPFNAVNGIGFQKMMKKFDPAFYLSCYTTIKKDLDASYQTTFQAMKELIINTCDNAVITTDLWTSHAKQGYIGITCHWLNDKMELCDILLCVEPIKYPHTGDNIRNTIISKLESLGLSGKVNAAVTDNGSNMVKAIREWVGVERIPCSAHTLQLCVAKGLQNATPYLRRCKKLNKFFNSPKQNERLEAAQRQLAEKREEQIKLIVLSILFNGGKIMKNNFLFYLKYLKNT
jgi:zinc finger BED domain-containing protein 1 (E3 SUMO-protein ligase ZBED1)